MKPCHMFSHNMIPYKYKNTSVAVPLLKNSPITAQIRRMVADGVAPNERLSNPDFSTTVTRQQHFIKALQGALIVPMQCSSGPRSLNVIQQDDFCIVICMSVFLYHCHHHHQFEEKSI